MEAFAGILIATTILSIFLTFGIPILIIWLIVRLIIHFKSDRRTPILTIKNTLIMLYTLATVFSGVAVGFALPFTVASLGESSSEYNYTTFHLVAHLAFAICLLAAGQFIGRYTGKVLMITGVILLLFAAAPSFSELGSGGAFLGVLTAFVALIWLAVRNSKKGVQNG
jgi:hypothetical protein